MSAFTAPPRGVGENTLKLVDAGTLPGLATIKLAFHKDSAVLLWTSAADGVEEGGRLTCQLFPDSALVIYPCVSAVEAGRDCGSLPASLCPLLSTLKRGKITERISALVKRWLCAVTLLDLRYTMRYFSFSRH